MGKIEATVYGDRKVYAVSAFNRGVAGWLRKLPEIWVEGEVTDLRHNSAWAVCFLTLKDPETGATLPVTMRRRRYDALGLNLSDGERVHVQGRAELFEARGALAFRAGTIERFGLGDDLAALERLKRSLAAEGLFADETKRQLPRFPRAVGLLTGADAAARGDIVAAISARFPPARVVVAETRVQGSAAPTAIVESLAALAAHPDVDVVIISRGGGSFEDLLPFSDERVVRAVAACSVPVVSAVGHEQDTPLCDLAADVRASTPTAAARLVVPDLDELVGNLSRSRERLGTGVRRTVQRDREHLARAVGRLRAAPRVVLERRRIAVIASGGRLRVLSPQATLERGYAIARSAAGVVRSAREVEIGDRIDVQLAEGAIGARVEETAL